jgi:hypothetical protein
MLASMPYPTARDAIDACQEGEVAMRSGQRVIVTVPVN